MITLSKFPSKDEFILNAELIETIEQTPDTIISLVNGKRIIVLESPGEIVKKVIEYRQEIVKILR